MQAPRVPRVPLRVSQSRGAWVALGALVLPFLSGCIGGGHAAHEDVPTLAVLDGGDVAKGEGAIDGTVLNENGAVLNAVHLILVGTTQFTDSDKVGHFRFDKVKPGRQFLRADLKSYAPLESHIDVEDGKVASVTVTLISSTSKGIGFRDHVHDFWGEETVLKLYERNDLTFAPDKVHGGNTLTCVPGVAWTDGCTVIPITPELDHIVWPGTASLEVTVDWVKKDGVKSVDFQYTTANATVLSTNHMFTPGETKFIEVAEGANDHGHQRETLWSFRLYVTPGIQGQTIGVVDEAYTDKMMGPFSVKILAHKGSSVPTEPAHTRYWAGGDRVVVAEALTKTLSGTGHARDPKFLICTDSNPCFSLSKGKIVPPGTTKLEVTLTYDVANSAAKSVETKKTLGFRTGAVSARTATWNEFRFDAPTSNDGGKAVWTLRLKDGEADAFYQAKSVWNFAIAKVGDERGAQYQADCPTTYCGGDKFTLHVEAINEEWTPDLAAG